MAIDGTLELRNILAGKIVWKAIDGGWGKFLSSARNPTVQVRGNDIWVGERDGQGYGFNLDILFQSHPFCRAFWGSKLLENGQEEWLYHCNRMMFAKDAVEYMRKYL